MSVGRLALAHGLYWAIGGLWPLVHLRSFEAVFGPKREDWLVQSVAVLMACNGLALLLLARVPPRELRIATTAAAAGIGFIALRESLSGRISPLYAIDGFIELLFASGWAASLRDSRT